MTTIQDIPVPTHSVVIPLPRGEFYATQLDRHNAPEVIRFLQYFTEFMAYNNRLDFSVRSVEDNLGNSFPQIDAFNPKTNKRFKVMGLNDYVLTGETWFKFLSQMDFINQYATKRKVLPGE